MSYNDRFGFVIRESSFQVDNVEEFLFKCTYTKEELEDNIDHIDIILRVLRNKKYSNSNNFKIAEIGFGSGRVTEAIFKDHPKTSIISYDRCLKGYTSYAKLYLETLYGNHVLILGDPRINIVKTDDIYDVIIIDENYDLRHITELAGNLKEDGVIIINDITPHNNFKRYEVYKKLILEKILFNIQYTETIDFKTGVAVVSFNINSETKRPSHFFDKIERKMESKKIISDLVASEDMKELESRYTNVEERGLIDDNIEKVYNEMVELFK